MVIKTRTDITTSYNFLYKMLKGLAKKVSYEDENLGKMFDFYGTFFYKMLMSSVYILGVLLSKVNEKSVLERLKMHGGVIDKYYNDGRVFGLCKSLSEIDYGFDGKYYVDIYLINLELSELCKTVEDVLNKDILSGKHKRKFKCSEEVLNSLIEVMKKTSMILNEIYKKEESNVTR